MSFVQNRDFNRLNGTESNSSLAFSNLDIFDMQRFFTCVIKIQCDMLLCYVNNNETPAKLSEVDANGIIPLPIRTTVLVG